jgi:hypothetical protein
MPYTTPEFEAQVKRLWRELSDLLRYKEHPSNFTKEGMLKVQSNRSKDWQKQIVSNAPRQRLCNTNLYVEGEGYGELSLCA